MKNNMSLYIFNKVLRTAILLSILYLIITNLGTILIIITLLFLGVYFFIYRKIKEMGNGFTFTHTQNGFKEHKYSGRYNNFDFNNFNEQFTQKPTFIEVEKAKNFFGFTHEPTKEEIKKRYKELAKKYHPDINNSDDTQMQQLNHYKEVLLKHIK